MPSFGDITRGGVEGGSSATGGGELEVDEHEDQQLSPQMPLK